MDSIGKRIKHLRDELKLSQQEIADITGISRGNISNYEKGRVVPAADTIIAFARYFNVSTDWLLTGAEKANIRTEVTGEEKEMLKMYRDLSPDDKEFIKQIIMLRHGQARHGLKKKGKSSTSLHGKKPDSKLRA